MRSHCLCTEKQRKRPFPKAFLPGCALPSSPPALPANTHSDPACRSLPCSSPLALALPFAKELCSPGCHHGVCRGWGERSTRWMCSDTSMNCQCGSGHGSIKPGILSLSIMEKRVWKDLERSFNPCLFPKADSDIPVSCLTEVCGEPGRFPVTEDSHPEQAACFASSTFIKEPKSCLHVKPVICCPICQGVRNKFPFSL